MSELKACPFCGRENPTCIDGWVYCKTCDDAIDELAWQKRPIEDVLQADVARLREALEWYGDEDNYIEKRCGETDEFFVGDADVIVDNGQRARDALKGSD